MRDYRYDHVHLRSPNPDATARFFETMFGAEVKRNKIGNAQTLIAFRGIMNGVVVIAASAGGLDPLRRIIAALPVPCTAAVFVVMHIGPYPSVLPHLLGGRHVATFAQDGTPIEAGHIYIAPPDHHMYLGITSIRLSQGPKLHHTRPAADPLFISAAEAHRQQVLGVVLSGGDSDGADGLRVIVEHGGTAFVQDPQEAANPSMPSAAIAADHPHGCLSIEEIAEGVRSFCTRGGHGRTKV